MVRFLTAGESHGPGLVCIIDGCPAGLSVDIAEINHQLARRQKGYGRGGRMKIERDKVTPQSGLRHGQTLGSPISFLIENKDWENWTEIMDPVSPPPDSLVGQKRKLAFDTHRPRPGHADLSGAIKYHHHDLRNVLERASARETAAKVACGAVARQFLESFGIQFASHVVRIGVVSLENWSRENCELSPAEILRLSEESEVRCIDSETEKRMIAAIREAISKKDSLGGVYEVIVSGVPVGLGSYTQWDRRLDGKLAQAFMSVPSVKGVEIGLGFESTGIFGSVAHDEIFFAAEGDTEDPHQGGFRRQTNRAGGIEGGISNGQNIVVRVAAKPISTLYRPLQTVDLETGKPAEAIVERTDHCVVPAHCVIGEAVAALVLFEAFLDKFGADNMDDIRQAYQRHLDYRP